MIAINYHYIKDYCSIFPMTTVSGGQGLEEKNTGIPEQLE